jgi:hypothetical protein
MRMQSVDLDLSLDTNRGSSWMDSMDSPDFLSQAIRIHADLFHQLREELASIEQGDHDVALDDQTG